MGNKLLVLLSRVSFYSIIGIGSSNIYEIVGFVILWEVIVETLLKEDVEYVNK